MPTDSGNSETSRKAPSSDEHECTPLTPTRLHALAHEMLHDYDAAVPGRAFANGLRLDLSDAWKLQGAVAALREARGEKVVGYKVGCVDPGNREFMGLEQPVWGRLWESEWHDTGVALAKADFANISLEAGFGVTLSRALQPGMSADDITASIEAVYPVLELHNLVLRGEQPYGSELIANNTINCGVVAAAPTDANPSALVTDLQLVFDDVVVGDWQQKRWPEDILEAVGWLTSALFDAGISLQAGDRLLCGAWGPPVPVATADHCYASVKAVSSAFGSVRADFT